MFHNMPGKVKDRMRYLEKLDAQDRLDGTARMQRLRQITPETGQFLAILAAGAVDGKLIEIGTSAGYSTLWLAMACIETKRTLTTFEILDEKVRLARETFGIASIDDVVELIVGDARQYLLDCDNISFCFLDAEKEIYLDCYEMVIENMASGGLLVADNAINHRQTLQPMLDRALSDTRVDALIVPIGKGELVCRKL